MAAESSTSLYWQQGLWFLAFLPLTFPLISASPSPNMHRFKLSPLEPQRLQGIQCSIQTIMGKTELRSRIRLRYVKENTLLYTQLNSSSHYTYTANVNQAAAAHREKLCSNVQAVGKRKWAVKYTVHSMQALRPLSTMTHCSSDSTWLRSPCPGRMPWSSGGSTPCSALPCCPFCSQATSQHCSSTAATVTSGPGCEGADGRSHGTSLVLPAQGSDRLHCRMLLHRPACPLLCHSSRHRVQQHWFLKATSLKHCTGLCQQEQLKLPTGQPTRTHLSVPLDWLGLNRAH